MKSDSVRLETTGVSAAPTSNPIQNPPNDKTCSAAPCVTPCAAARPRTAMTPISTRFNVGYSAVGTLVAQEPLDLFGELVDGRQLVHILRVGLPFELFDGGRD